MIFRTLFLSLLMTNPAASDEFEHLNSKPFGLWSLEFQQEAVQKGVSPILVKQAFTGLEPDASVIKLDRKQPEKTKTFTEYLTSVVSNQRIKKGKDKFAEHRALLHKIGAEYGVQPRFIAALWGIETNYGGYTGNHSTIQSLATLAYDGRRSDYFRGELLNALKIIDAGHIDLHDMDGSWAGALGQCQFMPTSFLNFAVDYNGDGKKDIWDTPEDIFASIANYLKQSGWSDDLTWGRKVKLPAGFNHDMADGKHYKSLSDWQKLGVNNTDGSSLPDRNIQAAITLPGKADEAAYMIYKNYDVILKWNRSRYFATAVGTLSDHLQGL